MTRLSKSRRCKGALPLLVFCLTSLGAGEISLGEERGSQNPVAAAPSFNAHIRPLLRAKCSRCHDQATHKGELALDSLSGIQKGGESGAVVVPGKPDESSLYEKVSEGSMPPDGKNRLAEKEVALIRSWIAAGARGDADAGAIAGSQSVMAATQHEVIPILLRHCTGCHGLRLQEAGLNLSTKSDMLKGGKSGAAIFPGRPDESLLIKRIRKGQMPPPNRLVEGSVKPVDPSELDILVRWIGAGAPEALIAPDVATETPDPEVTKKDREFWAFQPPRAVDIPAVKGATPLRNPIDAFVLQRLERKQLSLAPEADRMTLLRRASFDLTGLPPDPADVLRFLSDPAPDAFEREIERLLNSPRYGERWGGLWLDLAGYADSEGKREQDLPRPHAWRYRDYVIRAFNDDKPYDRFLLEQIAGDELADYEHAPEITPALYDNLVATGFLRMTPDATWANITGYVPDRIEVIADEIDVLGSVVMGLTMKCARCHSHKFDPIPQRDYYRLLDIFKGAYDEYDWLKPDVRPGLGPVSSDNRGGRLLPHVTGAERREWEAQNAPIEQGIRRLRKDLDEAKLKSQKSATKTRVEEIEARIRTLEAQRRPQPAIQALWDRGVPSPTYIYRRGDPTNPGRLVGPGVPSVLTDGKTLFAVRPPWPNAKKTGRRLAFARWLVGSDHPLTARVAVNRIWQRHFGTGIVKTLGNFGKAGMSPSHPELLDWLAREFIRRRWSMKAMHRLMMTSAVYRQSSALLPTEERLDPENALFSRQPLVRLDAESLYDTLLFVSGQLNETCGGPGDAIHRRADGLVIPIKGPRGRRRMIYVEHLRKQMPTELECFDYPQMNPNCIERRDSTVVVQALHMMNAGVIDELARSFASRAIANAGTNLANQVDWIYLTAFGRPATDEERKIGQQAVKNLVREWSARVSGSLNSDEAAVRGLASYCHAIMNSAAFLYVD